MKTPWHNLLQYGTAVALLIVVSISALILMSVVATAIVVAKIAVFIK